MAIRPEKIKELEERLRTLGIFESDIVEKFIRCQGKGGQKLNKTSSGVYLHHIPTNIEVKCQKERSQAMNRFFARRILAEKIESLLSGSSANSKIEKIRKQKQKRASRARRKCIGEYLNPQDTQDNSAD